MSGAYPIGTEHTPNWLPGYVPPAAEWNMWWSNKVDFDDTRLTGGPFLSLSGGTMTGELILAGPPVNVNDAVTKAYVDQFTPIAGPFLPMSGGTMTGILTLASNPVGNLDAATRQYVDGVGSTASQALTVAQAAVPRTGATMTGPLQLSGNPTTPLGAATKQYVDGFLPLWGGNLYGPVGSSSSIEAQNLYSSSTMLMNAFNSWEWSFSVDGNGSKIQQFRAGWYNEWEGTTGNRYWVGPGQIFMTLDGGGNLNVIGQVTASSFYSGGNATFNNGGFTGGMSANTVTAAFIHSTGNIQLDGTLTGGTISVPGSVSSGGNLTGSGSGSVGGTWNVGAYGAVGQHGWFYSGTGSTYGFQFWYNGNVVARLNSTTDIALATLSDANFKDDIQPVAFDGLAAISRLELFKWRWKNLPRPDDAPEVTATPELVPVALGFVAQQVDEVFPEAVWKTEKNWGVSNEVLIAALCNAVQQLSRQLADLKTAAMKA